MEYCFICCYCLYRIPWTLESTNFDGNPSSTMWPLDHDRAFSSMEDKGQRKIWKGKSKGEILSGGFREMLQLRRKRWPAPQRRSQLRSPVFVGLWEMLFAFPSAAERKAEEIQLFLPHAYWWFPWSYLYFLCVFRRRRHWGVFSGKPALLAALCGRIGSPNIYGTWQANTELRNVLWKLSMLYINISSRKISVYTLPAICRMEMSKQNLGKVSTRGAGLNWELTQTWPPRPISYLTQSHGTPCIVNDR